MFDVFRDLRNGELPASGIKDAEVTSFILKIMRWTMFVTLAACCLVTAKAYIGDNISCITGFKKNDTERIAIENYCFVSGTFSIINLDMDESPHPGVGPPPIGDSEDNMIRHAYYQWVPIVLFLQAAIFYLPTFLWNLRDSGYFNETLCTLDKVSVDKHLLRHNIKSSAEYFNENFNIHRIYAVWFLFCEIIAFSISVGNLYFTNTFLGGHFFDYGVDAIHYLTLPATSPNNPLNIVFPKVSKCTWYKYGASGTINTHDAMCVLPLNIVNEKTYICLWIVYITTAAATGILLLWHIILFIMPSIRNALILRMSRHSDTNVSLQLKMDLQHLLSTSNYGDWFFMYQYSNHMAYFKEWVAAVRKLNNN